MPSKLVTFEKTLFASSSTPEADEAWGNDLTPPGDGFVLIPNPKDYSLPPGQPTEEGEGEIYDISVFHQLHCLNHVRTFLFTLKAGMDNNNTRAVYDTMLAKQEAHVYHCFDYIRQALMCHADLTVEWPRTEANGERFAVDGWGISHQCVKWVSACCTRSWGVWQGLTMLAGFRARIHGEVHGRQQLLMRVASKYNLLFLSPTAPPTTATSLIIKQTHPFR